MLAVWAYAYEFDHTSLVSDGHFDQEARKVDLSVDTARPDMDQWFREQFDACTGSWIYQHPELDKIEKLYEKYHAQTR